MAVNVIGTLEPKNNGNFPVANAKDVWTQEGKSVEEEIQALKKGDTTPDDDVDFVKDFEAALGAE